MALIARIKKGNRLESWMAANYTDSKEKKHPRNQCNPRVPVIQDKNSISRNAQTRLSAT